MNWLDIVLLLLILLSTVASFRKGFSREVIGLAAAFVALLCGLWFYGSAGAFLLPYVSSPAVAHFAGFVIVFIGILILGGILSMIVSRFVRTVGLSGFDRMLGGVFGLVRGVLIAVALIMAIVAFAPEVRGDGPPTAVVNSRLAPYVIDASRLFAQIAPHELKDGFRRRYEQVKSAWEHALHPDAPRQEL